MRQRICYFLVVFVVGFCGNIFSQHDSLPVNTFRKKIHTNKNGIKSPGLQPGNATFPVKSGIKKPVRTFSEQKNKNSFYKPETALFLHRPVPQDYYSSNLSFFCKKELQIEKLSSVPLRFRLGSLDYVNWLEQKPNAMRPQ